MKWVAGRQSTGYEKLRLAQWKFFDVYLIRYRVGAYLPAHTDPVPNKRHFRLNIVLKKAALGGIFNCEPHGIVFRVPGRVTLFRPDRAYHSMSKIEKGTRYVFSIGVAV